MLTLLSVPADERDLGLSEAAREAVMAAIAGSAAGSSGQGTQGAAAALRAELDRVSVLTPGERHLLDELLRRISDGDHPNAR